MKHFDWSSFFSNILAVVLGIFITFTIQGWIDRSHEKKDVAAALELVKEELINNNNNLRDVIGLINAEKNAATAMFDNLGNLQKCDYDSVATWNTVLGSEYFFTVTDDALELLKSSSLFQKINDKNLALSIIKAYDYLEANSKAFNTHEQYKISLFMEANTDKAKKLAATTTGLPFLKSYYSSPEGTYFLKSVVDMSGDAFLRVGLDEIDATIANIAARKR